MRVLTAIEIAVIAGGDDSGFSDEEEDSSSNGGYMNCSSSSGSSGGDQRNQEQKDAADRLAEAQKACSALQFGCATQAARVDYYTQSEAYNICRATGGQDGPSDCGRRPSPPTR